MDVHMHTEQLEMPRTLACLTANCRGLRRTASCSRAIFSGVRTVHTFPNGCDLLHRASLPHNQFPIYIHNNIVLRLGTESFRLMLKCTLSNNHRIVILKKVSTTKARCSANQRSIVTKML
ncbi:hypothetical protein C0J52_15523 [Blattella germanica]|nr:hypothetical protein C0J52_15523 [Blattella germanica]